MKCPVHRRPSNRGHSGSPVAAPTTTSQKGIPSLRLGLGFRAAPLTELLQSQAQASVSLWQPLPAAKAPTLNVTPGRHLSQFPRPERVMTYFKSIS